MNSTLRLVKYTQRLFYIEYLIYNQNLSLWIKGCQFFRNFICDATHNNPFGPGLTAINELHMRIYYIIDDIYMFF